VGQKCLKIFNLHLEDKFGRELCTLRKPWGCAMISTHPRPLLPSPKPIRPQRLPRRKALSIAVGIKCQNGLVVCADREMANADYKCYEAKIKAMVEATLTRYGRIDILVNNAGILIAKKEGRAHELTNEAWDRTMNVNLRGYWLCSKYVIPSMLTQGRGCIILIASPTGMLGFPGITAYSTSKGACLAYCMRWRWTTLRTTSA
jgi:NAD(P)-dependent dehydrogenase (short-subunit alcohol dehydrogenase family)